MKKKSLQDYLYSKPKIWGNKMASKLLLKKMEMFVSFGDMLWLGSADEGTFLFTKYKDIMGIYSRDLTWFESKIIPALYPILIYSDIPLGKHL